MYAFFKKHQGFALLSLLALLSVSIAIVACNNDMGTNNGGGGGVPNAVTVNDNFFSPANMMVSKGTTVTWSWKGNSNHTVTSGEPNDDSAGSLFDFGPMNSGSAQFTFNNSGTFHYFCRIHGASMSGTITVQ
jgi:plastocyanin